MKTETIFRCDLKIGDVVVGFEPFDCVAVRREIKPETIEVYYNEIKVGDKIVNVLPTILKSDTYEQTYKFIVEREIKPVLVDGSTARKAYREGKDLRRRGILYQRPLPEPNFLLDDWEIVE